jgi:hypothetical protein
MVIGDLLSDRRLRGARSLWEPEVLYWVGVTIGDACNIVFRTHRLELHKWQYW